MNRATPEDINQAMRAVQVLLDAGLNFVPIPVMSAAHKVELHSYGAEVLEQMAVEAEKEENND